jgi:hypothetical protein
MPYYRKLIIIVTNSLFRFVLFFTISIVAAVLIYTDRNYIAKVLSNNDAYANVIPAILESNKNQPLTVGGEITLNDPEIQQIISSAFPSDELETHFKTILNSTYDWVEQDSASIDFRIDLTENRLRLAEGLSTYAINRLQTLPSCSEIISQIDPFSATCNPLVIDNELERIDLEKQLLSESGFLENPIITQKSILGENTISIEEQFKIAPTLYSLAKFSPFYILLFLIALALIVIFASSTRKIGMRKIGRGMIGASGSLIFFTVVFSFILPSFTGSLPIFQSGGNDIDSLINKITLDMSRDYALMIIKLSVPLLVIGYGLIFYARRGRNEKNYKNAKLKSGLVSSNEVKNRNTKTKKRTNAPIQSSESSDTKPKRKLKNKKYRKIPKKEI